MTAQVLPFEKRITVDLGSIEGRVAPHDLDAEAAVLANVIIKPKLFSQASDLLKPERFYSERHRRIWEAIEALIAANEPIDIVTVGGWMKARERLAQVGGLGYLTEVLNASPAIENIRAHALLVHEAWRKRVACLAMMRAIKLAYGETPGEGGNAQAWLDESAKSLVDLARLDPSIRYEDHGEIGARALDEMARVRAGDAPARNFGIPTGIDAIDRHLHGLSAGHLTIIAAVPGGGKTTIGDQIASHVAAQNIGVLFFAVADLNRDELFDRRMARLASVPHETITRARFHDACMSDDEIGRHSQAVFTAARWPLVVVDKREIGIEEIRAIATRARDGGMRSALGDGKRASLGMIVVDYIQEVRPPVGVVCAKRWEWSEHTAPLFKKMAEELGVAVVALAQMHKPDARAKKEKPKLGSTRGSAEIEAKATTIAYLWKPDPKRRDFRQAVFAKARGVATFEVDLELDGPFAKFTDPRNPMLAASRAWVDRVPEPPPGRFADDAIDGDYR